jgi:hypothetical protein
MTRIEFASTMVSRIVAWKTNDKVSMTIEHIEALLLLARKGGSAPLRQLTAIWTGETRRITVHMLRRLQPMEESGYVTKKGKSMTLTDKGKLFVNTILK